MNFPALTPSARTFSPGNIPQENQISLAGNISSFRRGNRRTEQRLTLSYTNLTESQVNEIRTHYVTQQGTFDIFFLSSSVWSGYTTPPIGLLSDYAWRYSNSPTITDGIIGRWSADVELVAYAIDTGDLVLDGGLASATPARDYTVVSGLAAAAPARDYVISPGGAA